MNDTDRIMLARVDERVKAMHETMSDIPKRVTALESFRAGAIWVVSILLAFSAVAIAVLDLLDKGAL